MKYIRIIQGISINIHNIKRLMSRNKEHRPNGSAAEGGRPIGGSAEGGASVFFVSAHLSFHIMNIH